MGQTEDANIVMMPYPQQRYHLICNFKEAIKLQIMSTSYSETDEIEIPREKKPYHQDDINEVQTNKKNKNLTFK